MDNQENEESRMKKEERTRVLSSLVVFRRNKNICRYLPFFVNTRKMLYASAFCLILWIDGMKELAYLQPESVQTSVLLVCGLLMRRKSSRAMQI